jgi:glycerate-2-kinase
MVDPTTMERAAALGLDPRRFLDNNDSYHFFSALDDLLRTGPTGTNVGDVQVALIG